MAQKVQIENFLSENAKAVRLLERTIQEIAAQKTVDERIALNSALASIRCLVESQDYRNSYRERPSIFENDFAIPISNNNVEMTVSWGLGMHKKRIEKNLDLEYVSSKTGIPVGVLDAFESGKAAPTSMPNNRPRKICVARPGSLNFNFIMSPPCSIIKIYY